nr:hypothetical protein [Prescottella equi]
MPREYGKAWFSMFTDDHFTAQPNLDKFLYMTLLGQPSLNYAGVTPINFKRWRKAVRDGDRVPSELEVKAALIRLERNDYVFSDDETGEVLVRSFMRRDEVFKQPNVMLSSLRAAAQVESRKLARVLQAELERIALPTVGGASAGSERLRSNLAQAKSDADMHLSRLSEGFSEPFAEPFSEDFPKGLPEPLSEGFSKGFSRPGEMEPFREGFREGFSEGSVVVEVEVANSPTADTYVGSACARANETATEPPNPHCPKHPGGTSTPCTACGVARAARRRWDDNERRRQAEEARAEREREAETKRRAIEACGLCDGDGYRNRRPCDHNPDQDETNARGREKAWAAIGGRP